MENRKKMKIDNLEHLFNKKYDFKPHPHWKLPSNVFKSKKWIDLQQQIKKTQLNEVKEKLSLYDLERWSKHTRMRDPSTFVLRKLRANFNLEFLTQAWCKFYEILCNFDLISSEVKDVGQLNSLHLCEAPGAFVCALNHYLVCSDGSINWNWLANALNSNYEGNSQSQMITDDRFIKLTLDNWHFGADFTGDITNYENYLSLSKKLENSCIRLVTADGSIDCMFDPGNQELYVQHLHYCETMIAITNLSIGGNFVLKIFTIFEESTINLLYLLNCVFNKVSVFKPLTSKSGNSEVYVICLNYVGKHQIPSFEAFFKPFKDGVSNYSMFNRHDLPNEFLEQIDECSAFFMKMQISKIQDNIKNFENNSHNYYEIKKRNHVIADYFIDKYNLTDISEDHKIIPHINVTLNYYKIKTPWKCLYKILNMKEEIELDIKVGRKLTEILHSNFYNGENLHNFNLKNLQRNQNSTFYNIIKSQLTHKFEIINLSHFNVSSISQLHSHFFKLVKKSIDSNTRKDLLLLGPFFTNFLTGILFLLVNCFKCAFFHKNGYIVLKHLDEDKRGILKKHLERIRSEFEKLNHWEYNSFEPDILQVVSDKLFEKKDFLNCLCGYNENLGKFWGF